MSKPDRIRDIMELEVFLFGGVPEMPEPVYERDSHTHSQVRTTRTPIEASALPNNEANEVSMGYVEMDLATGELTFSRFVPPGEK